MKSLPYFRWYAADWSTDRRYTRLTDQERGFFHRCLNHSWINYGLPIDLNELAEEINSPRRYIDKLWPKVGAFFVEWEGRLFNEELESERANAISKSENNARYGNANASKQKRERVSLESPTRSSENANGSQHAHTRAESECVSESAYVFLPRKESAERKPLAEASMRFAEFWERYPLKDGAQRCSQLWLSIVTTSTEDAVFACLDRYLASDHVARGVVKAPQNWLHDSHKDGWKCDWPARAAPNGNGTAFLSKQERDAIASQETFDRLMKERKEKKNGKNV